MCIFCKIANHEVAARVAYEDDEVLAFHDLNPQAPTHVLVIPRKHIVSLDHASGDDQALLGKLLLAAQQIAKTLGLSQGYRTVLNTGAHGGQSVFHMHVHLLGGRPMGWPPG